MLHVESLIEHFSVKYDIIFFTLHLYFVHPQGSAKILQYSKYPVISDPTMCHKICYLSLRTVHTVFMPFG